MFKRFERDLTFKKESRILPYNMRKTLETRPCILVEAFRRMKKHASTQENPHQDLFPAAMTVFDWYVSCNPRIKQLVWAASPVGKQRETMVKKAAREITQITEGIFEVGFPLIGQGLIALAVDVPISIPWRYISYTIRVARERRKQRLSS